jgi:hypothetical protein
LRTVLNTFAIVENVINLIAMEIDTTIQYIAISPKQIATSAMGTDHMMIAIVVGKLDSTLKTMFMIEMVTTTI